jgi:ribosomal-protein-alanine N-acetyltransferase
MRLRAANTDRALGAVIGTEATMREQRWETARLYIRPWEPATEVMIAHEIYGDPAVMQYIRDPSADLAATAQTLQKYRDHYTQPQLGTGVWAVVEKVAGIPIGSVLLVQLPLSEGYEELPESPEFEMGWHFRRDRWGQSYAREAASCILNYGVQELGLSKIYAVIREGNWRSQRLAKGLGMQPQGKTSKYYNTELLLFEYCGECCAES